MKVFDPTPCRLGEGPLWHHGRQSLLWFDILNRRMFERAPGGMARHWDFPEYVSTAGIIDNDHLLIASQSALSLFDLSTSRAEILHPLEADNPVTRSNDGRADPWGGFWIGTMGINLEPGAGAIWRLYKGELRRIFDGITISNAICFDPDGEYACFCDTPQRVIRRVRLDRDGWPKGEPAPFIDLRREALNPDGAVIDTQGCLWSAQWGAGRIACYDRDGGFLDAVAFPASQISCPAFGGADMTTLFATSANEGLSAPNPTDGQTFATEAGVAGQAEYRVRL